MRSIFVETHCSEKLQLSIIHAEVWEDLEPYILKDTEIVLLQRLIQTLRAYNKNSVLRVD